MRLSYNELYSEILRVFEKYGMNRERAELCARVHTDSSNDGIYSHGANRVVRFANYLRDGWVLPNVDPTVEKDLGAVRIVNGNLGPGISNAFACTDMGIEMARKYGIGMVGLHNTTHWMRGGTYGLYAAEKGMIAILWTNTESCMPPWGAAECRIGNNPFVMAMPGDPEPLFLDMAMSQYSYGKLEVTRQEGKKLPYPGGFTAGGELTDDPGEIEKSTRILPMGFWKGSGFAVMLDVLAAVMSDGIGAADIDHTGKGSCGGASQIFIIIDPSKITDPERMLSIAKKEIDHVKSARPVSEGVDIHVPGEGRKAFHRDHEKNGIFVDDQVWADIRAL